MLFQIELIIAKILLFKFGGTYTVWGAAVVFFQGTLLLGYLYSHFVIKKIGIARYRYLHLALFLTTLFFFPGKPLPVIFPQSQIPVVFNIFRQLLNTIGPAFFALSTISIIFQSWVAESELPGRLNPYTLYATSNLGSFAGLLTYPFLFEQFFGASAQLTIWRIIYFVLFGLQIVAFKYIRLKEQARKQQEAPQPTSRKEQSYWFLLSAAGVIMFLSVTNIITYEITPMPLLWIFPLCIYLISFVLNFKNTPYCPKNIDKIFFISVSFNITLYFLLQTKIIPNIFLITGILTLLFITCMFCQNELNKHKPADTGNLTLFYLIISSGGFIGGIFVSWVMPLISVSMIEYLLGLFIIFIALFMKEDKRQLNAQKIRLLIYYIIFILIWPFTFQASAFVAIALLVVMFRCIFLYFNFSLSGIINLALILFLSCHMDILWSWEQHSSFRNYYGIYIVRNNGNLRLFLNGNILHGAQYLNQKSEMEPLTYYHRNSPVGRLLASDLFDFKRMGFIGLGTGTLAAYGKPNQTIDFFELDQEIFKIVNKYFTFLKKSQSKINYIFGDARSSLSKIPDKHYGLMIIDAFSGDSVPVHLLTCEAIEEYIMHTTDTGLVLFHISNRYFNLIPLLYSNAEALNLYCAISGSRDSKGNGIECPTLWVALTKDADTYKKISALKWVSNKFKKIRPWTDQYSNLLSIFKAKYFFSLSN